MEEKLTGDGFTCINDHTCSKEALIEKIGPYTGLVLRSRLLIDKDILKAATSLKFIARSGSGLENIDLKTAGEMGIRCFNSPEGNCDAVGEQALAMLLSLFNHIPRGDREVRHLQWKREENRGMELGGKTVGIIGYGHTGKAFARKLSGFSCRVLAYDKFLHNYGDDYAEEVSLDELYQKCDVVSLHVPYNKENHYLANGDFFNSFSKAVYFINTSRGMVLETNSLVSAMRENRVLGACLDVMEYEKHSFEGMDLKHVPAALQYLIESERIILSPHVAGWTVESYYKLSEVLYRKIQAWVLEQGL